MSQRFLCPWFPMPIFVIISSLNASLLYCKRDFQERGGGEREDLLNVAYNCQQTS